MPQMKNINGFSVIQQLQGDIRWQTQTKYTNSKAQEFELTLLCPDKDKLKEYIAELKGYVELVPLTGEPPKTPKWPMSVLVHMQVKVINSQGQAVPCQLQAKFATAANAASNMPRPVKLPVNNFNSFVGNIALWIEAPSLAAQSASIGVNDIHIWLFPRQTNVVDGKVLSGGIGNIALELLYRSSFSSQRADWLNSVSVQSYGTLAATNQFLLDWGTDDGGNIVGNSGWYALKVTNAGANLCNYKLNIQASRI